MRDHFGLGVPKTGPKTALEPSHQLVEPMAETTRLLGYFWGGDSFHGFLKGASGCHLASRTRSGSEPRVLLWTTSGDAPLGTSCWPRGYMETEMGGSSVVRIWTPSMGTRPSYFRLPFRGNDKHNKQRHQFQNNMEFRICISV